jgi:hypothetical protein
MIESTGQRIVYILCVCLEMGQDPVMCGVWCVVFDVALGIARFLSSRRVICACVWCYLLPCLQAKAMVSE